MNKSQLEMIESIENKTKWGGLNSDNYHLAVLSKDEITPDTLKTQEKAFATLFFWAIITRLELLNLLLEIFDKETILSQFCLKANTTDKELKEFFKFVDLKEIEEKYINTSELLGEKVNYGVFLAINKIPRCTSDYDMEDEKNIDISTKKTLKELFEAEACDKKELKKLIKVYLELGEQKNKQERKWNL